MDNKKIGNFIAQCRKSLGLNQQQLAEQLGVSNKTISKWETGEGYPDISTIPELCRILCISADDFFAGEIKSNGNLNNCIECENSNDTVVGNTLGKNLFKLGISNALSNIILIIIYVLYIAVVYYAISSYLLSFQGEVISFWVFFCIPVLNIITGLLYTLKRDISVLFCVCIINGFAIVPLILSISGGLFALIISLGYILTTFFGTVFVLFIKSKYEIKFSALNQNAWLAKKY